MCPSFFVTREEQHTTRGRARALFEMFQRDVVKGGWSADEVKEALDLCLGCKGCKKECPVNVDMATYKSEFLTHYYRRKLRPRNSLAMGLIGYAAPIAGEVPFLANIFTQFPLLSNIVKFIGGISQKRPLPAFANEPFTKWYSRMGAEKISFNTEKTVVLYPDVFNNYFYPKTLKAAYEVLRKWGYHVIIPRGRIPESRPLIHYGMLGLAKRELQKTITMLSQYVRDGIPVIVLEPSSLSVFRDELPDLFPGSHDGMRVTELTMQLSEFIEQNNIELPVINKKGILHGHCHQKAVLKYGKSKTALKKMKIDFSEPQNTCCGMAGSFGFEAPHYETSISIAELGLYPAIRASDSSMLIIADGFSCRTQIKDGTGRDAYHLAEVIDMAIKGIV
jgi:Fe-S oxidoreductase